MTCNTIDGLVGIASAALLFGMVAFVITGIVWLWREMLRDQP